MNKTLKELRTEKGLTLDDLSADVVHHPVVISNVENGLQVPIESTRRKIEMILGPVDWITANESMVKRQQPRSRSKYECELTFWHLVRCINSMKPSEGQEEFILQIIKFLRKLNKSKL